MEFYFLVPILLLALYFAPALDAWKAKKTNLKAIFWLNLLLGWTVIGWVVALVWALTKDTNPSATNKINNIEKNMSDNKSFKLEKGQEKNILWVIIGFFSLIAIISFLIGSYLVALEMLIFVIILLPQTEKFLKNKYNFNLSRNTKIVSVILIFALFFFIAPISFNQNASKDTIQQSAQVKTPEMIKAEQEAQAKAEAEKAKVEAEWKASKAGQICQKHPGWEKGDCEELAKNKLWIGMTIDMLKYLRGTPNVANPSNYGSGTRWQWCWDDYTPSCFYGGSDGVITSFN